ncbi:MAG TPA: hypothetical protein VF443_03680, partial [Nitrospira sp.]
IAHARASTETKKRSLDNLLTNIAHEIIESMPGRDWDTVPPVQCMTAAAIAIDKSLLLRGEPGEIIETRRAVGDDMAAAMERMTPAQRDRLAVLLAEVDELIRNATTEPIDKLDNSIQIEDNPTDKPTVAANPDE